jgi:N-acetylmuramoyl-L-alanine amidase
MVIRVPAGPLAGLLILSLLVAVVGVFAWPRSLPASRVVAHRTVCIDAGHGGIDPGAVGSSGVLEKHVNLAISKYLRDYLEASGARVVLTREGDEDPGQVEDPVNWRKIDDLVLRVKKAAESGSDIFICIHCNKFPSPDLDGAQTFYCSKGHPDSKRLAEAIQAELKNATGTWREAMGGSEQYVLREMKIPACTVEVGFLSNPQEEKLLSTPGYQAKLAWAIYLGIVRFFAEGLSA